MNGAALNLRKRGGATLRKSCGGHDVWPASAPSGSYLTSFLLQIPVHEVPRFQNNNSLVAQGPQKRFVRSGVFRATSTRVCSALLTAAELGKTDAISSSKGSRKNNFTEFALRFGADWVDLREHNRKRRQAYVEDCVSEDRPKMA